MRPINGKHECADALALLSLSLDQALSPLEQHKLERHIRDCPDCRQTGAAIEAFTRTLRALPLEELSFPVLPRLPMRRRLVRTGFPAAAAIVVASLGLVALQGSVNVGSGGISPIVTVPNTATFSPVTHSLSSQPQEQHASAAVVWLP